MRPIVKAAPILMTLVTISCSLGRPAPPTSTPAPTVALTPVATMAPLATATATPPPTVAAGATPSVRSTPAVGAAGVVRAAPLDTAVKLEWAPVSGAQGYLVYRDASTESLNLAPIPDTTYEDIGLTNGKTYSYTVAAVDSAGKVIWTSGEVGATPGGR